MSVEFVSPIAGYLRSSTQGLYLLQYWVDASRYM